MPLFSLFSGDGETKAAIGKSKLPRTALTIT
jgi:hypothetical protein